MNENKKEAIKERIATQREFLRGFIIVFIAILTGIVTVLHNVANGTSEAYMLISVAIGFVGLSVNLAFIKRIYFKIDANIKELENV
jgi:ACR3 family arsenite efflux pump ArsB